MKKQKSEKKGLKWILLAAGILVLAAAVGLGLWFLLGDREEAAAQENHVTIYWNVDRADYVAANADGTSGRYPRGDGYYYIRLAANGVQEDYLVEDYALVNRIDLLDYFCPVFDENGVIVDVKTINECTGGLVAPALYVESVDGNTVKANTQGTYLGVSIEVMIDEETEIYGVSEGVLAGMPEEIGTDDEIIAIKDLDGTIGTVFVRPYEPVGDIYWNIHRKYDSTSKTTTRDPDVLGYYNFELAINGEVKTFRTRDYKVANNIDQQGAKCFALTFDENGDIATREKTSFAGVSTTFGSWYHVTGLTDTTVTAERIAAGTNQGDVVTGVLAPDCKIIDVSAMGGYSGAYTELRVGDQIHGLKDNRGRIAYIFVHVRLSDETMPLYWNVSRKYSSSNKSTTRTPDADGWYYAEVTTGGNEPITVKTKDKDLMSSLDSYAARCFTMSLTGDNEIVLIGSASAAHGGGTFGSWYYVDSIEGDQLTVSRILSGDSEPTVLTGTLSPNVEVINGSTNYKNYCGEYAELQVGDRVHCLTDLRKQIRVIFIVERPVDVPIYWNLTRGYNSTTKSTTKTPDADGFYWFTFAVNGEQQTLKTRSKEIADKVDSAAARCWGLSVWNGEITKVHSTSSIKGYSGGTKSVSWVDVISIEGQYVVCQKNQAGHEQDGKIFNVYLGNACEIYDVSDGYTNYAGEPTTLRVGDKIHAFHDGDGIAMLVWVVGGRSKPINTEPNDCPCAEGVTWEAWDGTTELVDGCYYYLTNDVTAPTEGFILENQTVYLRLDGHTIQSDGRCFFVQSGGKLSICDHDTRGKLVGTGVASESGGVVRMYSSSNGAVVNLWNIDVVCNADSTPAKEGGAISCSGPMTLHNVNVIGGVASTKGGNVQASKNGTFRMFGGSLQNGYAKGGVGGNLNVEGVVYLEDVTVSNGTASSSGDNIYMTGASCQKKINGLAVTGSGDGIVLSEGTVGVQGTITTKLSLPGTGTLDNMGIDSASKITLTKQAEGTIMTGATTDLTGLFTNTDTTGDFVIAYDSSAKEVYMDCTIEPVAHTGDHCACLNGDLGLADHTCQTLTGWTEITDAVFETAMGTNNSAQGVKFIKDGNYYVSANYTLPDDLCIMPEQNITICLNGCQLRGNGRVGMIAGTLTITDCVGSGQAYNANSISNGVTFKVLAGGELNVYGGTITGKYSTTDGGVVCVSQDKGNVAPADCTEPGVFNLYGGTVTGGSATNGGNIILWHTTVFNMYGGKVSDGTATTGENISVKSNAVANLLGGEITGGNVQLTSGKLNVGGSVKIDELIASTVAVSDKGLKSDAAITMTAPTAGTLVTGVSDSNYTCFNFVELGDGITIHYDSSEKAIIAEYTSTHNHCVCGGVAPAGHTCSAEGWMPLNAETVENYFSVSSSRYVANCTELYLYLTDDLDLTYSINLNADQTIHLCLNGFELKHTKTSNPVMRVWGDLDITDCSSGRSGSIIGSRTGEAPCLYIQNWKSGTVYTTPTVNLFAGTLTADDGDTSSKAGVCQIGNKVNSEADNIATFNMYGGKICGGDASNGGNVYIEQTAVIFNMYGGTITDGNATKNGGGIFVTNYAAKINIVGGTVSGNTAGGLGDDVYTPSVVDVTLGGMVNIGEYYSNSTVLTLKNLNAASSIKILRNTDAPATFATGADTDVSKCFTNPTMTAVWDESAKTLTFVANSTTEPEPDEDSDHKHCLCAEANGMPDTHTCTKVTWTALTQADFDNATADSSPVIAWVDGSNTRYSFADGGYYYLAESVTITYSINQIEGTSASICLNGLTLTGDGTRTIFTKGTLNITDCVFTTNTDGTHAYTGAVEVANYTAHAPALYVRTGGTVALYGGNIVGTKLGSSATTGGGAAAVSGELNIYDGKICGGDTSAINQPGGNMVVLDGATVNMWGGSIEDGKASSSSNGGNLRVVKGTFNLYGGVISGGAAKEGGNITVASGHTFNMYGGTVENGTASAHGGNFMVYGNLNISGGTIQDGSATTSGGNISNYANKTNIKITGGLITNGKAPTGANIAMRTSSSVTVYLTITGGKIEGVQAGSGKSVNIANSSMVSTTVGGSAVVDEIYLAGSSAVLTISTAAPLTSTASIGISAAAEQTVATAVTALTGLKSADDSYELVLEGTTLKLAAKA